MHIHALLESCAARGETPFILQIGAMDGHSGDPVHPFLMRYDWPALLVEPVAEYFERLCETYRDRSQVRLANVAVAGHDGTVDLYRVDPAAIESGAVPGWGRGAASLYPDRTALHWDHIRPHVGRESVDCLTLNSLIERYDVAQIDVLHIDAEGHDYAILRQLDFNRYRPAMINLEIVNLPEEEQEACKALLRGEGYRYEKTGYDLVAVLV